MTSLVLTRFKPGTGNGGSALRNWQNIQGLGCLGPVDVVSVGAGVGSHSVAGVRFWQHFPLNEVIGRRKRTERMRSRLWRLRRGAHPMVEMYRHVEVVGALRTMLARERYDVALISEVFLAGYLPEVKRAGCRIIFDCHNIESALATELDAAKVATAPMGYRLSMRLLQRRMFATERHAAMESDVVWACSETDAHGLEQFFGLRRKVAVVPNGVNVAAYRPVVFASSNSWDPELITLLYPGTFSFFPNEDAALRLIREVLPALRAAGRAVRVMLVGRDLTDAMRSAVAEDVDVVVTGAVESILPYFHQPCVVTLPISVGSGTRLKVLEAFAAGCPVVSTSKAVEGIDGLDGLHLLVREGPVEIATAVMQVWDDQAMRMRLCTSAFELVRDSYSWEAAADRIAATVVA